MLRQLPESEITAEIFGVKDEDGSPRWSTRSWTPQAKKAPANGPANSALDLGMPVTLIGEAVFARALVFAQGRAAARE